MSLASRAAEVLDKVLPPWEPTSLLPALFVCLLVGALAASSRTNVRVGGLVLAALWAALRLGTDEWFSSDVGPALQAELTGDEARRWFAVLMIEAFLPVALVAVIVLVRRRKR